MGLNYAWNIMGARAENEPPLAEALLFGLCYRRLTSSQQLQDPMRRELRGEALGSARVGIRERAPDKNMVIGA